MNGGYLMVSKSDANLYGKLNNALTVGKPILWYEDETTCYYIDTITKSGTDIVLTKGGKTITVESDGDITEIGDVLTIMENIVDGKGNKRFIEGDVEVTTAIEGLELAYGKWSLSGSHLMVVVSCSVADTTVIPGGTYRFEVKDLPSWIIDKIVNITGFTVDSKNVTLWASDYSTQSFTLSILKTSEKIMIMPLNSITLNKDRVFRVQFDLLIDAE